MERALQLTLLSVFIFFCQFYKLDSLVYRLYDEGHRATNAYEMSQSGKLIVTTIDYTPDMFGTKPPLMIWAEAASIKLFGMNELAVRLPAALASALTILLVFGFILYLTGNGWSALLAGIVLCTTRGYISADHGTRFGEYDGVLPLFTTLSIIFFYLYAEQDTGKRKNQYLFLFFVWFTLGVLTKGITILMFGPALFIYLLIRKQVIQTINNKYFYTGLVFFIVFGLGYYFLRESMNPGYLLAVYNNELGGRYAEVNDGHSGPFSFYFAHIKGEKFGNWFWTLPVALVLLPFNDDEKRQRLSLLLLLASTGFILVLSSAASKLFWYDMPAYPLFAMLIAILFIQLADYISWAVRFLRPKVALILLTVIFSIQPLYEIIPEIGRNEYDWEEKFYSISYYLRGKARSNSQDLKNAIYIDRGYMGMAYKLYIDELNDKGMNIRPVYVWYAGNFQTGDKIISNDSLTNVKIESNYQFKTLEQYGNTKLYTITGSLDTK